MGFKEEALSIFIYQLRLILYFVRISSCIRIESFVNPSVFNELADLDVCFIHLQQENQLVD